MNSIWSVLLKYLNIKKKNVGNYMNGYLNNMRKQIIVLGKSWNDIDEYEYHMASFINVFGDKSEGWNRDLHKWLFE